MRPIALFSDFSLDDIYVGQMHAAVIRINPEIRIIDCSHGIAKYNVRQAAFRVRATVDYLPDNVIVVAVVDPGVGSNRRGIVIERGSQCFIGPDNGIFSPLVDSSSLQRCWQIFPANINAHTSNTFHGRDIFAPLAARLATGENLHSYAQEIDPSSIIQLGTSVIHLSTSSDTFCECHIIDQDSYGNCILDLQAKDIPSSIDANSLRFVLPSGQEIRQHNNYSEVEIGELLILINSSGFFEIARREASAAELLHPLTSLRVLLPL